MENKTERILNAIEQYRTELSYVQPPTNPAQRIFPPHDDDMVRSIREFQEIGEALWADSQDHA